MSPSTASAARAPSEGWKGLLLLAALAFVPYLSLPDNPLILDSHRSILDNAAVREGDIGDIFTVDFWGVPADADWGTRSYRPLVTLTYALQLRLIGPGAEAFHLADMSLHALGVVLFVLLARQLRPGSRWIAPAAAVFAVHPVLSETVSSAVGRADLMASIALLGALVLHLRARRSSHPLRLEAIVLLLGLVALLSKEYAVIFPFLLVAVDLAVAGASRPGRDEWRRWIGVWAGAFVLLGGYLSLRWAVMGALGGVPMISPADHPLYGAALDVRWGTAAMLLLHAARLLVAPIGLNYFYGYGTLPIADGLFDPLVLLAALLLAAGFAGALLWLRRRNDSRPLVGLILFAFPLGPSLNTVSLAGVLFAERYLYLPAAGFALLGLVLLERLCGTARRRRYGMVVVVAVTVVFGVLTAVRVEQWESAESLALSSVRWYPGGANVWFELGLARGGRGDDEAALAAFERSLDIQDGRPQVWREYAVALLRLGQYEKSAQAWRRALDLSAPDIGPLWRGLGGAELAAGHHERAVRALQRAHDLMPEDPRTTVNLAKALLRLAQERLVAGEDGEALALARRAVRLEVLPPEATFLAGLVIHRAGDPQQAQPLFRRALERDPALLEKRHEYALSLSRQGEHLRAAQQYRDVLAAQPDHVPSLFYLGHELLQAGRPAEAAHYLRQGLALREDATARSLLRQAEHRARSGGSTGE
jgi:tetratricopeptide (TPR) repeat protein